MKLTESHLLEFRLELEELICEKEAMIAFNQSRKESGFSVGYDESAFLNIGDRIKGVRDRMTHLMEK